MMETEAIKGTITAVNSEIVNAGKLLIRDTESAFAAIHIPVPGQQPQSQAAGAKKPTPPITYILYGVGGLAAVAGLSAASVGGSIFGLAVAAASVYGGHQLSHKSGGSDKSAPSANVNIAIVKNSIAGKVIETVKRIKAQWETAMTDAQKKMQLAIESSSLDNEKKDFMMSKTFVYEVLDISLSTFNTKVRNVSSPGELQGVVNGFKAEVIRAINDAVNRQTKKYESILL